jgi:hypothetical protein
MKIDKLAEKESIMYDSSLPYDHRTDIRVNNIIFQKRVIKAIWFIFSVVIIASAIASFFISQ